MTLPATVSASLGPPSGHSRIAALAALFFAVALVLVDQWTKQWAIDNLAGGAHVLAVRGDATASATALWQAKGVGAAELQRSANQQRMWLYRAVDPAKMAASSDQQRGLLALGDAVALGLPGPRRMQVPPGDTRLADLMTQHWRVPADRLDAVTRAGLWRAVAPLQSDSIVPRDALAVLHYRERPVIAGFMKLVYAENPGAAWGMLREAAATTRQLFFGAIAVVAGIGMTWAIWTGWMGSALGMWALAGVLGGALGNLIDRVRYSVVIDFVLNYVGEYSWPVYNVADIGITVGVALIMGELLLHRGAPDNERQGT